MITTDGSMIMENGQYKKAEKLFGLSTDTKPTDVGNGSRFIEINTGKQYLFDATGSQWNEYSEGGSGGGGWALIGSDEFEVSTTSTSAADVGTIDIPETAYDGDGFIIVHIRDKAGKRDGYFYGIDSFFTVKSGIRPNNANASGYKYYYQDNSITISPDAAAGVYAYMIDSSNKLQIKSKYSSTNTKTIDGTFKVDVYKLIPPFTMFE